MSKLWLWRLFLPKCVTLEMLENRSVFFKERVSLDSTVCMYLLSLFL